MNLPFMASFVLVASCTVHCLSAHRSFADCRLIPSARPMSDQDAPSDFAAATAIQPVPGLVVLARCRGFNRLLFPPEHPLRVGIYKATSASTSAASSRAAESAPVTGPDRRGIADVIQDPVPTERFPAARSGPNQLSMTWTICPPGRSDRPAGGEAVRHVGPCGSGPR